MVLTIIKKIFSALLALLISISTNLDTMIQTEHFYLGNIQLNFIEAIGAGQGIATDGTYYYNCGTFIYLGFASLEKIDVKTGKVVEKNWYCMPKELIAKGYNHFGGMSYYNKKLYIAVESSGFERGCIVLYDAQTLEYTGEYHELTNLPEAADTGNLPWCAVDKYRNCIYTSQFENCNSINVYSLDTFKYVKTITTTMTMSRVQGGDVYEGTLYLSCDEKDNKKNIYSLNPDTGVTEIAFTRNNGKRAMEAEDLVIYPFDDGSFYHVIDFNSFISIYIRSFTKTGEEIASIPIDYVPLPLG